MRPRIVAEALAAAFLDGTWSVDSMCRRGAHALGRASRWLPALVRRTVAAFPDPPRDRFDVLAGHLAADKSIIDACASNRPFRLTFVASELAMRDVHADWGLPRLDTAGDLASWVGLEINDLLWFADARGMARRPRDTRLSHYHRRWLPKRSGGLRLVEAPKRSLKELQRRILHHLLDRIPPHEAAHGFRRRRGILTHAQSHAGRDVVLRMDLKDFFVSIPAARVAATFRAAGYPFEVANLLTGLCTTRAPIEQELYVSPRSSHEDICALRRAQARYRTRHLPQGAPTSPALANLCAYGLDVRLSAVARAAGAIYTRYADDLVFSGDERLGRYPVTRFASLVGGIALEEGFAVQHRKTRIMRAAVRQEVTGLVVNRAPAIRRTDYECLKATLHNCVRFGPELQNRDGHPDFRAHLEGMVAWVTHVQPARGARLRALLAAVQW